MNLASIWRHPIKAVGREEMGRATLSPSQTLPSDRRWAVTHDHTREAGPGWAKKANFLRGVSGPQLMAVTAETSSDRLTLRHPNRPDITLRPETDGDLLVDWLDPIWPAHQPRPTGVATCATGFTDVPDPWLSIGNLASHRAVEGRVGRTLSIHRWRANLWLDGMDIWHEFELVGKTLAIGSAKLEVRTRITRCRATEANPETGQRDADTLGALRSWDHQDFGIYAEVVVGGEIAPGDTVEIL